VFVSEICTSYDCIGESPVGAGVGLCDGIGGGGAPPAGGEPLTTVPVDALALEELPEVVPLPAGDVAPVDAAALDPAAALAVPGWTTPAP
jgi:hypothetical protein